MRNAQFVLIDRADEPETFTARGVVRCDAVSRSVGAIAASEAKIDSIPREIVILVNDQAGQTGTSDSDRMRNLFAAVGVHVAAIEQPPTARAMLDAAATWSRRVPGIVVVGGDGALNAVLPACGGQPVTLGALPRGTVNVWAREIGLPRRIDRAIGALGGGRVCMVDLGCARWIDSGHEQTFLLMAGVGFDGEVTRLVDRSLKRRVGLIAYGIASLAAYFRHEPYYADVEVDGVHARVRLTQLIVANCRMYGGDLPLAAQAEPADGWLDLWTLGPAPRWRHAARFFSIILNGADPGDRLLPRRARSIRVAADHAVAIQVDGDPVPEKSGPVEFTVRPSALRAWLPAQGAKAR